MTNQKDIMLSVVVPAYNIEDYLEKCVDSIAQNLTENTEILIIDDGSTDLTGNIADNLEKKYENVQSFHKTNGGLSDARNYGINKAAGKYLMFIDGDDYVNSSINDVFEHLKTEVDVVFVGCTIENLTTNKKVIYKPIGFVEGNKNIVDKALAIRTIKNCAYLKLINRKFLLNNNLFFKNGFSEDFEWTGRLFCHVKTAIETDINYYHYLAQREGSIMNIFNKKKFYDIINHANSIMHEVEKYCTDKFVIKRIKQYIGFNIISIFRNIKKCASKQDKIEVEQLLKNNIKLIKPQKSLLLKAFVLGGRIFGFRFMYKFA